jgi:hypothetical protein
MASPFHLVCKMDDVKEIVYEHINITRASEKHIRQEPKGDIIMFMNYLATPVTTCREFG